MSANPTPHPTLSPIEAERVTRPARVWRSLEELPTGIGVASDWRHFAGDAWPAWQRGFLDQRDEPATSFHCAHECGCAHRVVQHDDGRVVAVCECDPWNCEDIPLTARDVVAWEFNHTRLARAVCRALELERREQNLGLPWTQQVATFSAAAVPVAITIQQERGEFRQVVADLAARWREGFILFAPTSRFVDGRVHELLSHARAKFFDLESHVRLLPDGTLHAPKRAGELFAQFVTRRDDGASDNEAVRVFALMKSLGTGERTRKAPLDRVFRLLVLEGLSQEAVAVKCQCSPGLVSLRVTEIERRMSRPVAELRALASRLGEMDAPVKDSRAGAIYRRGLADDTGEE